MIVFEVGMANEEAAWSAKWENISNSLGWWDRKCKTPAGISATREWKNGG